jgi:hypothetical protein
MGSRAFQVAPCRRLSRRAIIPSHDSSSRTRVLPARGSRCHESMALMPSVLPVQEMERGASSCRMVDVLAPGPAFQRNVEPTAGGPSVDIDRT